MSFFNSPKLTGDNNIQQIRDPLKKMTNALVPKPQGSEIGSPKFKMPENGGDPHPRAGQGMMSSHLGASTKPMPSFPQQPLSPEGGIQQSLSPKSGLAGVKKPPSASSVGKHLF
jgi:hypothetical protein